MDIAYRQSPEKDLMGMVYDVKRAIHWIKSKAADYLINPDRIVIGGGLTGGTLALLAAYTAEDLRFNPREIAGTDLSCSGVISINGPTNLAGLFSPFMHVNADCPPSLLIHGKHDIMVPVDTVHLLKERLDAAKLPVVEHILPQSDHAFYLALPKLSPTAHTTIYDMERFLALMV